jgi:hypothetical protein
VGRAQRRPIAFSDKIVAIGEGGRIFVARASSPLQLAPLGVPRCGATVAGSGARPSLPVWRIQQ